MAPLQSSQSIRFQQPYYELVPPRIEAVSDIRAHGLIFPRQEAFVTEDRCATKLHFNLIIDIREHDHDSKR